jgi:hypothetical protein
VGHSVIGKTTPAVQRTALIGEKATAVQLACKLGVKCMHIDGIMMKDER